MGNMDRERKYANPTINAVFEGVLALLVDGSLLARGARGRCIFWSSKVLDLLAPSYIGALIIDLKRTSLPAMKFKNVLRM